MKFLLERTFLFNVTVIVVQTGIGDLISNPKVAGCISLRVNAPGESINPYAIFFTSYE